MNPTAHLAAQIAHSVPGAEHLVLPVEFRRGPEIFEACLRSFRPDGWLGLGLAPGRTKVEFEMVALNLQHATTPDNQGECPFLTPIKPGSPLALSPSLPHQDWMEALVRKDVPCGRSFHAGTFLCNQIFYCGVHFAQESDADLLAGFVHVPYLGDEEAFVKGTAEYLLHLSSAS